MKKATTSDLKKANIYNVFRFIYKKQRTSKLELFTHLQLSRPTIDQCLKELEGLSLVEKSGFFESTGGRKAEAIVLSPLSRVAVGVELLKSGYEIVAADMCGNVIKSEKAPLPFQNSDLYFRPLCAHIRRFIAGLPVPESNVLGVGFVLQGLISADGTHVTYGKILECTGLTIDCFTKYLPYPCRMFHDAEAAATVELWENGLIQNAIYFHIRDNLSGAFIAGGRFLQGNELKSGVFEHMTIVLDGEPCYCGKRGCMDCYCSTRSLLEKDKTLDDFFASLRAGRKYAVKIWDTYLNYLAIAIDNLHMMIDYDIILGGTLAPYLQSADLDTLHRLVARRSAFPSARQFIKISSGPAAIFAKGGALPYIRHYLDTFLD